MSYSFNYFKNLALSCKDKSQGRMLTGTYRLHYDPSTDSVSAYIRCMNTGNKLFTVFNDDTRLLTFDEDRVHTCNILFIQKMLDVYINTIPIKNKLRATHNYYVSVKGSPKKYVYIQEGITLDANDIIIEAKDYTFLEYDKEWNRKFINLSKKRRASIYALHKMMPEDIEDVDTSNLLKTGINNSALYKNVANLILYENISKDLIAKLRYFFNHSVNYSSDNNNLRVRMQRFLNEMKSELASKEGAFYEKQCKNIPK